MNNNNGRAAVVVASLLLWLLCCCNCRTCGCPCCGGSFLLWWFECWCGMVWIIVELSFVVVATFVATTTITTPPTTTTWFESSTSSNIKTKSRWKIEWCHGQHRDSVADFIIRRVMARCWCGCWMTLRRLYLCINNDGPVESDLAYASFRIQNFENQTLVDVPTPNRYSERDSSHFQKSYRN